ncbi:MAG: hypothetical protein IJG40_05325 [Oscillospiraceae bacterium]|nr:hypothetical protein [Oscillospiraceae bacterium]
MKLSLSYRLRSILADKNLTQADLVKMCEMRANRHNVTITRQDIHKYINGISFPSDEKLNLLADALNVPEIWLLGYETAEAVSQEELNLLSAWRLCTDKERETIAFILKDYGFTLTKRDTLSEELA